jgi:hypothetical protein
MARLYVVAGESLLAFADEIYVGVAAHAAGVEARRRGFGGWRGSARPKRRLRVRKQQGPGAH